jgi:hypothetical protein
MEVATERRREVEQLRGQLADSEAVLHGQRGQVEAQLADVQPLIDAARTAVGGIKADHINEVRSTHAVACTCRKRSLCAVTTGLSAWLTIPPIMRTTQVRSLRMPSDTIRDVLEGVLLLMGQVR